MISLNIEYDRHLPNVLKFLKKENADVVCLQEVLEKDFLTIKEALGMRGYFVPWSYSKSTKYPYLRGEKQGLAIFSNTITNHGHVFFAGQEKNVSDRSFEEYLSDENWQKNWVFLWVQVSFGKQSLRIITTQLPTTKEGVPTQYQLETIQSLMIRLDPFGEFILCGDTNAPRGREAFGRLARRYKDNIPVKYKTSIDQNLHHVKGIQLMVDGLFTTPDYRASNVRLVDGVSDHMAVVAKIAKN